MFPLFQFLNRCIVRQIDVERRDGDIGIRDGLKIRIASLIKDQLSPANPIILFPSRVHLFDDGIAVIESSPLSGYFIGFDLLLIKVGDIDIQKCILWKSFLREILATLTAKRAAV